MSAIKKDDLLITENDFEGQLIWNITGYGDNQIQISLKFSDIKSISQSQVR